MSAKFLSSNRLPVLTSPGPSCLYLKPTWQSFGLEFPLEFGNSAHILKVAYQSLQAYGTSKMLRL